MKKHKATVHINQKAPILGFTNCSNKKNSSQANNQQYITVLCASLVLLSGESQSIRHCNVHTQLKKTNISYHLL